MNLIILDPGELGPAGVVRLSDARALHARTVLKVAPGDEIRVGLVDGPLGTGVVREIDCDDVVLDCRFGDSVPPRPVVDLLLALPRPKVMRRLWPQLAALGVDRILLTNASRVERQYFDTHLLQAETYRPLLIEGLQQAKDTRLPRVSIHKRLKVLLEDELTSLCGSGMRLLADPSADSTPGSQIRARPPTRILLAIGPEGGWNVFEQSLFAALGFEAVGMGRRTLRTDTACIALLALVTDALSEGHAPEGGSHPSPR